MTAGKAWLESFLKPDTERAERRGAERRAVEKFAAFRWDGNNVKQEAVRNISATGVYILTEERWPMGAVISLTLQREGFLELNPERRIETRAKVTRHGEDGVGLKFVMDDPESDQWESLRQTLVEQVKPKDMWSLVRVTETLMFLSRICPGEAEVVGQLICGRLSNHKLENAVVITLKAQSLLSPIRDKLRADPGLVVRILEDGSCTDEDWLKNFWGGLLATACAVDGKEESSPVFVDLFSKLTTFPVRLLTVVCTRATKVVAESGVLSGKPLHCKIEELTQTTGSRGVQIERDLDRLCELGLIEKKDSKTLTLLNSNEVHVTPTGLGLELFARCNGHRGSLRSFYAGLPGHTVRTRG
jgi:hypothetical protein